ncbi:MAG: symmetrical bis(5'-nucleosyl)-tetraphosphatase [Gammaproteobacteria bacterium]|nr:symmetrical bis(5'-nucleosyl)-tetraphosphatase [Gammaproteobacteria bacterium]
MAVYAIGDIQGCFDELQALLARIEFDPGRDRLWLVGDLVNRGPHSLRVLRFVKDLGERAVTVLGNHDLHLLATAYGCRPRRPKDTFNDVLEANDREELLDWLRRRPLLHHDAESGYTLIHAGLPPQWDLAQAQACAREVESSLRGPDCRALLENMYGDGPERWSDALTGWERLRFSINCFARLRYCDNQGRLNLEETGPPGSQPAPYRPWFAVPGRASADLNIVFGHWATLGPRVEKGVFPLDTGCVWGGALTALRLDDRRWFSLPCKGFAQPGED